MFFFFFFKQKTAYEMCGRDWSSDVCSSDLSNDQVVTIGNDKTHILRVHLQFVRQPAFILVMLHFLVTCFGENTFISLFVDYIVKKEVLTATQAALGMTISGGCMIAGSLTLTLLSHWHLDRLLVTAISEFSFGLAILFTPLSTAVVNAYPLLVVFGFFEAIFAANIISLISHEFGDDHLMAKVSYMYMSLGFGSVIGPIIAGQITALMGGDTAFYLLGTTPMIGGSMMAAYWLHKRRINQTRGVRDLTSGTNMQLGPHEK